MPMLRSEDFVTGGIGYTRLGFDSFDLYVPVTFCTQTQFEKSENAGNWLISGAAGED